MLLVTSARVLILLMVCLYTISCACKGRKSQGEAQGIGIVIICLRETGSGWDFLCLPFFRFPWFVSKH